ncbi:MAG TPA: phage tail tape measure protein, partial [Bacteroidia bacterium]|nr:phage tail tape measure protein [Bacteroidia bacterium]
MGETTTTWNLRLKENVMGAFQKIKAVATGVQSKFNANTNSLKNLSKQANSTGEVFKRSYGQLENILKSLEKRQKAAFSTEHILKYQSMINKTKAEMDKLNQVTNPTPAPLTGWAKYKSMMQESASEIPGLSRGMSMLNNPMILLAGGAALVGATLLKSTQIALNFNEGMAKVNATAQLGDEQLGKLKGRLKEIGSSSGGNFELIPGAYEKILSQTNKVNLSLDILETSVKGAKAGFTDIDTVAGALARTLSIVGEKNATAAQVMDTLFAAKKFGAGEFKDFAQYLPQLVADGKVLGINFKDVAGIFAFMTAKGQSAADATMLMKNAFTAMNKLPILKEMEKTGIKVFDAKGMRRNISDILGDFTKKWQSLSDKGRAIFLSNIKLHDAQALTAFSVLTSDAEKFKEVMGGVNNSIGETNRQLELTQNYSRTWGDVWDSFKDLGEDLGSIILPFVDGLVAALKGTYLILDEIVSLVSFRKYEGKLYKEATQ